MRPIAGLLGLLGIRPAKLWVWRSVCGEDYLEDLWPEKKYHAFREQGADKLQRTSEGMWCLVLLLFGESNSAFASQVRHVGQVPTT
jgi:hypothetical protein